MARTITAGGLSWGQRLANGLGCINFLLVAAYAGLAEGLPLEAALVVPALLIVYNLLLASLIIRLPRRPGDQLMLHTLVISMLLLGIALVSRLLF